MSTKFNYLLTLAERKQIQRLLRMNFSCSAIAIEIGRSKNGIVSEVRRNGGRRLYDGEKAHNAALERQIKRYENLSIINSKKTDNHPIHRMKIRIDNLEMQLEILYETIKEMKNDKVDK